jgi:quercetin dioxygenase-like cupin family protein
MARTLSRFALFVALALVVAGTASAQDPTMVGPNTHKKILENNRVRMIEVTFAPGDRIAMHSHPDHAVYTINGGTLRITTSDGKTRVAELKTGEPIWFPAITHAAKNIGTTTVKLLVVELKEKPGKEKTGEKMPGMMN